MDKLSDIPAARRAVSTESGALLRAVELFRRLIIPPQRLRGAWTRSMSDSAPLRNNATTPGFADFPWTVLQSTRIGDEQDYTQCGLHVFLLTCLTTLLSISSLVQWCICDLTLTRVGAL